MELSYDFPDKTESGNPLPTLDDYTSKIYPHVIEVFTAAGIPPSFARQHAAYGVALLAIYSNMAPWDLEQPFIVFDMEQIAALGYHFLEATK